MIVDIVCSLSTSLYQLITGCESATMLCQGNINKSFIALTSFEWAAEESFGLYTIV